MFKPCFLKLNSNLINLAFSNREKHMINLITVNQPLYKVGFQSFRISFSYSPKFVDAKTTVLNIF